MLGLLSLCIAHIFLRVEKSRIIAVISSLVRLAHVLKNRKCNKSGYLVVYVFSYSWSILFSYPNPSAFACIYTYTSA